MDDTILCSQCGRDLEMKFIELKEKIFCSTSCFEKYRNSMSRRDFFRRYGDSYTPDEQHWVPKYANDYIKMCGYCPPKVSEACRGELDLSGVYHDELAESASIHWCCHALFVLSAALSDGTVAFDTALRVQRRADDLARKAGVRGVTPVIVSTAFADLAHDFEYKKLFESPPAVKELTMSHAAACLLCNHDFARQCEAQVEKEFQLAGAAKKEVSGLWCAHAVQSLAEMLIDRENGPELIRGIARLAEEVAREKGHPGVITRDLYIALGRSIRPES